MARWAEVSAACTHGTPRAGTGKEGAMEQVPTAVLIPQGEA